MKLKSKIILILGVLALSIFGIQYAIATKTTFSNGNPSLGIKGTQVTANFLNAVNAHFHTGLPNDGDGSLPYSTATGTNSLVTTITPTANFPTQYVTGMPIYIKASATNTGSMTLNINNIGAVSILKNVNQAVAAGDVLSGKIIRVIYDGSNFQLDNPQNASSGFQIAGYTAWSNNTNMIASEVDAGSLWGSLPMSINMGTASTGDVIFFNLSINQISLTAASDWAMLSLTNTGSASLQGSGHTGAVAQLVYTGISTATLLAASAPNPTPHMSGIFTVQTGGTVVLQAAAFKSSGAQPISAGIYACYLKKQ